MSIRLPTNNATNANTSASASQQKIDSQLSQAHKTLLNGVNDLVQRFDTRGGEQLFRSFSLTLTLEGADAGANFLKKYEGSINQLSGPQQSAFRSLLGDAREVSALQAESKRLSGLSSLQQLLSTMTTA